MLARKTVEMRVLGNYGYRARNEEGQAIVDFAYHTDMTVINTFYSKRESHKITYTSGGRRTQIDYILCHRVHLKEGRDCKVIPGESEAKQHHVVIGKMKLTSRRRREVKAEPRIKWWRLREKDFGAKFRQEVDQKMNCNLDRRIKCIAGSSNGIAWCDNWEDEGGQKKKWWWNEEVREAVVRKKNGRSGTREKI
ncbi:uncharacterized protein LOC119596713 [Penaeus monodon]|uniref:uncharacterized protein LOC119596713 n=1 Tax=Penaeus monodon TaxID=6687 RepID=UPI0018A7649E|nr:uncharacterized protein LOC119596713 [Penaeus monodon]